MYHIDSMGTSWDYRLVVLSVIIAIIGSYIALDFAGRMKSTEGRARKFWFAGGAMAMGLAIWSMHFIGMLALIMPMPVTYDDRLSALSILAATTGSGIAFAIMNRKSISKIHMVTGSIAMGLAIVTMHYTGMASMEMQAKIHYNPVLFALSVLIAIVASGGALWMAFNLKRERSDLWFYQKVGSAFVMGFAISGMHYVGMAAASYIHTGQVVSGLNMVPLVGVLKLNDLLVGAGTIFGLALLLLGAHATGERQRILEALRKSEERYELVIEGSSDGIWDWDHGTNTIFWNKRCYDQVGIPYDTVITGDLFIGLIHPDDKEKSVQIINAHLEHDEPYEIEARLKHTSGKYGYFLARGKSIRDESGKTIRTAGTRVDITSRKELEFQFAEAKEAAESANQNKSQFLANMSHELRTPLNAVIGYSEMLMMEHAGELTDKQKRYIHNVATSGKHLLDMVNDILDISKIEAGKLQVVSEKINIPLFIANQIEVVQEAAQRKNVTFQCHIQPQIRFVMADSIRLRQIFINLLSNAVKFNQDGGRVDIRVSEFEEGQFTRFEIQDTGIGIPEDKISEIFTEFYQVDNTFSRQHEGTGLGLALTKRLVELHGGNILVNSEVGIGSTFIFILPVTIPQANN